MRSFKILLASAGLALLSGPVLAQFGPTDGQDFIEAVQKRDADKANQALASNPTVIDTRDSKGDTGLIIAIRGSDADWTGFLLKKRADPNKPGARGETPLITAARTSFDEAVPWLLDLGAKVDATDRSGETALIVAVQQRDARIVKLLLDAGADPDRTDNVAGYSARDYATRDPRARDILKLISDRKPKAVPTAAK